MFPPSRRQLGHRSSLNLSKQDIPEDRVQFRISMPDDELSNLKGDFLMIIDELPSTPLRHRPTSPLASPTRANTNEPPLKFVAHGSHSELEDNIYQIRFFEADPNTGYVQDEAGFATVEWYVVRGEGEREGESYYFDGRVSYGGIGLVDMEVGDFVIKPGEDSREEQVLVGKVGGYQLFEDIIRRHGISEHHFSAVRVPQSTQKGPIDTTKPSTPYSTSIDLWKKSREAPAYEGLIEMNDLPHAPRTRHADSPFVRPLLVWLILSVLGRGAEEFMMFEIDGELVDVLPRSAARS